MENIIRNDKTKSEGRLVDPITICDNTSGVGYTAYSEGESI